MVCRRRISSWENPRLHEWWNHLTTIGPCFGYFANATKTWVVTKEKHLTTATALFANTGVKVTSEGRPYLGAAIGKPEFVTSYVRDKVCTWSAVLDKLSSVAATQPHAAHAAFTHGLSNKWTYLSRTISEIGNLLEPLELIIRMKLIPKLTGQSPPCDNLRHLLSLPARLGGIALTNPMSTAEAEFSASTKITDPLEKAVIEQSLELPHEITETQMRSRNEVRKLKRDQSKQDAERLKQSLPTSLQRSMDLAQEKGASTWFTTLPIREFGFNLHKGAFLDALALHYNWQPSRTPTTCACGRNFSVDHALSCPKGGFPSIRHNEIRDITANLLSEVCNDVRIEPGCLRTQSPITPHHELLLTYLSAHSALEFFPFLVPMYLEILFLAVVHVCALQQCHYYLSITYHNVNHCAHTCCGE